MSRIEPESYEVGSPDLEVLRFRFRTIQLARLPWREFLARPNPVAAALMAKMRFAAEERPKVKVECLRLLATLGLDPARMSLISGFVDTYAGNAPRGIMAVDVVGLGVDIHPSFPMPGRYRRLSGTSKATPHVTVLTPLLAEANPRGARGQALWDLLLASATKPQLPPEDAGAGLPGVGPNAVN